MQFVSAGAQKVKTIVHICKVVVSLVIQGWVDDSPERVDCYCFLVKSFNLLKD